LFSNQSDELFFKREEEDKIISALKPISERNRCDNLFLHGPTGSGKTELIKSVLNSIATRSVICLYINCWRYSTSMAIYVKIADALGEPVSRRGRATDEIFDSIVERMRKDNIGVVLALDEIDGLIYKNDTRILHNLARVANNCARFGVIGVSRDKNIVNKLDPGVFESLRFTEIEIKGYSKEQLFELIKIRAGIGLIEGSYDNAILEKIADVGIENDGNGRLVLELLRRAARKAQQEGKKQITVDHVEAATRHLSIKHNELTEEEQMIADILEHGEKNTTELYYILCRRLDKTKRQIRNYLRSLEMKGVIESHYVKDKYNYGAKIINLKEGWKHG
jgi:cell division control protein 6